MSSRYGGYEESAFVAELYDVTYNSIGRKDIGFFVDYSKQARGKTLELGCGTGRVLIPTAEAGCEITGLDISRYMLGILRDKLSSQSEEVRKRVRLTEGDMTDFQTGEMYALITTPFRPFQHLVTLEEQKACLRGVHRHLAPDGLFILDVFNPFPPRLVPNQKYMEEIEDLPETALPDGRTVRRTNRTIAFHRHLQYNDIEMIYYVTHPDGGKEKLAQPFPMRYFFRYELEHLLELCGFRIVDIFGGYDKSEFSADSKEMIFVAGKK